MNREDDGFTHHNKSDKESILAPTPTTTHCSMAKSKSSTTEAAMTKSSDKVPTKETSSPPSLKESVNDHLPPIILVFTIMVCSGFVFMYSFRDVFATGRTIGGYRDHSYLVSKREPPQW
jgi:hypothetical protein